MRLTDQERKLIQKLRRESLEPTGSFYFSGFDFTKLGSNLWRARSGPQRQEGPLRDLLDSLSVELINEAEKKTAVSQFIKTCLKETK